MRASTSIDNYSTNRELACAYADKLGWSVTNLVHATKAPHTGSHGWKDGTSSVKELEARWEKWPTDDPAIVPCRSDVVVADFDRRNGGYRVKQAIEDALGAEIFATAAVSTHDGEHFYYDASGGTKGLEREIDDIDGLDLMGPLKWMTACYVVAPRAGHPDANKDFSYEWATGLPWDNPPKPFPVELGAFLAGYAASQPHAYAERKTREAKAEREVEAEAKREGTGEGESEYLDANEAWVRQVCDLIGIAWRGPKKGFRSPLREDRRPSCSLIKAEDGSYRFRDFGKKGYRYYGLPQVYAAWLYGYQFPLHQVGPVEYRLWQSRLSLDIGWIDEPEPIGLPPLPPNAPGAVPKVWEGLRQALRCHALHRGGVVPIPFSYSFAGRWCGVTEKEAEAATTWLRRAGLLVKAGESKPKQGRTRTMGLWLPSNYAHEEVVAK